jgi:tripeptidyl-peptidase-1
MFTPSEETVSTVMEWLTLSGVAEGRLSHTDNKAWIAFDATAEEAESLLRAEYYFYEHTSKGHMVVGCDE